MDTKINIRRVQKNHPSRNHLKQRGQLALIRVVTIITIPPTTIIKILIGLETAKNNPQMDLVAVQVVDEHYSGSALQDVI